MIPARSKKKLGEVLREAGLITENQLEETLTLQKKTGKRLGSLLIELGIVKEETLLQTLSKQLAIPIIDLDKVVIPEAALRMVEEEQARAKLILPISVKGKDLVLAMANPLDWHTIQDLEFARGVAIRVAITSETEIMRALEKYYARPDTMKQAEEAETLTELAPVEAEAASATPIIQLVDRILSEALKAGASDIHIDPLDNFVRLKYRVDGLLRPAMKLQRQALDPLSARLKMLAGLDVATKNMPQEGSVRVNIAGLEVGVRVNILPTSGGESLSIKLMPSGKEVLPLEKLMMPTKIKKRIMHMTSQPQGLILISGPEGSGKTTTIYSLLKQMDTEKLSVAAVTESLEYTIAAMRQVTPNVALGLTQAEALRAVMRQDADVIMAGTIRDPELAGLAARAALSGRLVLGSLYANDAASTVTRLLDMGLSHYLTRSALMGVLHQRLLRRICTECKTRADASDYPMLKHLPPIDNIYFGRGCTACGGTGYRGRLGVYEFMDMDTPAMKKLITPGVTEEALNAAAADAGYFGLFTDAWDKVSVGMTTVDEVVSKIHI